MSKIISYLFGSLFLSIVWLYTADAIVCKPICDILCLEPPENCTRSGGAIVAMGCACCDTCVYTLGYGDSCALSSGNVHYQCGCNLQCDKATSTCQYIRNSSENEN